MMLLTRADSCTPMTSSTVSRPTSSAAGRLMMAPVRCGMCEPGATSKGAVMNSRGSWSWR